MFFKEISYAHYNQKYSKIFKIVLVFITTVLYFNIVLKVIYSDDDKAEFSAFLSLQCHMIFQKSF